jgi:hypothetical protein
MFPKAPQHRSEAWRRAVAALPCAVYMREGIAGFALSGWPRNVADKRHGTVLRDGSA